MDPPAGFDYVSEATLLADTEGGLPGCANSSTSPVSSYLLSHFRTTLVEQHVYLAISATVNLGPLLCFAKKTISHLFLTDIEPGIIV